MDTEDLARLWGVSEDEVDDLLEAIGEKPDDFEASSDDFAEFFEVDNLIVPEVDGVPDPDYMQWLAEETDFDISDLYDMYYGYAPGSD